MEEINKNINQQIKQYREYKDINQQLKKYRKYKEIIYTDYREDNYKGIVNFKEKGNLSVYITEKNGKPFYEDDNKIYLYPNYFKTIGGYYDKNLESIINKLRKKETEYINIEYFKLTKDKIEFVFNDIVLKYDNTLLYEDLTYGELMEDEHKEQYKNITVV